MSATDQAKQVHADLRQRLATACGDLAANAARRRDLALAAETGDVEAKRAMAGSVKSAATTSADIWNLEAAVAAAARLVAAAQAADRDEFERQQATAALALMDTFAARGAKLDGKLAEFLSEYDALCDDFRSLEALGYAPTTFTLVGINMRRAVAAKLMPTDLRQDFLAPHERNTFVGVIEGWARNLKAKATARINRNKPARAA